jgi:hypothetical protein
VNRLVSCGKPAERRELVDILRIEFQRDYLRSLMAPLP